MTVIIIPVRAVYTAGRGAAAAAVGTSGEAFVNQPLILRWSPSTGGGGDFSFSLRTRRFGVEIVSVGT